MAQAITRVKAFGTQAAEPITNQFVQTLVLALTADAADVTYDLSDPAGTFWTAVEATDIGAAAKKVWFDIVASRSWALITLASDEITNKTKVVAAPATGQVQVTVTTTDPKGVPDLAFFAAEGPTAMTLVLQWLLKPHHLPVALDM